MLQRIIDLVFNRPSQVVAAEVSSGNLRAIFNSQVAVENAILIERLVRGGVPEDEIAANLDMTLEQVRRHVQAGSTLHNLNFTQLLMMVRMFKRSAEMGS